MKSNVKTKFTVTHRILHALFALLLTILFITGFLRMYWMSKRTLVTAVENTLMKEHVFVQKEQLIPIAKTIQAPMWQWHEYAAFAIVIVFLARMIYMLAKGIRFPSPFKKQLTFKERWQGSLYVSFYLFTVISIITGFYLYFGDGTYKEPMEAIHKWGIYWFPIFIIVHFGGIIIGEMTDKKGIASKMIGGGE